MTRRAAAAMLAFFMVASSVAAEDPVRLAPLHVIPVENRSGQPIATDRPTRVRLSSPQPQTLAAALGVEAAAGQTSIDYVIDRYPQLRGDATRTWLEPTFVVDFTEPALEPLRQELEARPSKVSRAELVAYVSALIEASDERNWDIASVVARRRRGDCSEHAVLTAALARLRGIPARVVLGVALISHGKSIGAFGHAWTEMLEDGRWQVADAALLDLEQPVRYLPIGLMEDEGMGYTMDLMRVMRGWVDRVEILGP
jgi:transglutaminase-like putative cysteine protease